MPADMILQTIANQISGCTQCALHKTRTHAVAGEGPVDAEILLIGEGPGKNEDLQGKPFVGAAGSVLNELLAEAGLKREDVWVTNVVKCRPPSNRDPLPDELAACDAYLEQQIEAINPKIIITLGRFSMAKFIAGAKIGEIHGQMRRVGKRFIIPMLHPAAPMYNPALRPLIKEDFAKLPSLLEEARQALRNENH